VVSEKFIAAIAITVFVVLFSIIYATNLLRGSAEEKYYEAIKRYISLTKDFTKFISIEKYNPVRIKFHSPISDVTVKLELYLLDFNKRLNKSLSFHEKTEATCILNTSMIGESLLWVTVILPEKLRYINIPYNWGMLHKASEKLITEAKNTYYGLRIEGGDYQEDRGIIDLIDPSNPYYHYHLVFKKHNRTSTEIVLEMVFHKDIKYSSDMHGEISVSIVNASRGEIVFAIDYPLSVESLVSVSIDNYPIASLKWVINNTLIREGLNVVSLRSVTEASQLASGEHIVAVKLMTENGKTIYEVERRITIT